MGIKDMDVRAILSGFAQFFAQLTVILTVPFFIISHLAANQFFSSFQIEYFKYTDTSTAFSFGLESFTRVASLSLMIILGVIGVYSVLWVIIDPGKSNEGVIISRLFSAMKSAGLAIYLYFILLMGALIILLLKPYIDGEDARRELERKLYIPVRVVLNDDQSGLQCVKGLGSLGSYQVFVTSGLKPILVAKSDIKSVEPMFAPVPIESFSNGFDVQPNPAFEEEYRQWLEHWDINCPKAGVHFKTFDFAQD